MFITPMREAEGFRVKEYAQGIRIKRADTKRKGYDGCRKLLDKSEVWLKLFDIENHK